MSHHQTQEATNWPPQAPDHQVTPVYRRPIAFDLLVKALVDLAEQLPPAERHRYALEGVNWLRQHPRLVKQEFPELAQRMGLTKAPEQPAAGFKRRHRSAQLVR